MRIAEISINMGAVRDAKSIVSVLTALLLALLIHIQGRAEKYTSNLWHLTHDANQKITCRKSGARSLRISSIEIPAAVWNGSPATFVCNYELLSNDQLYSVKWYKNYVEFYRFQPGGSSADSQQVGQNLNLNQPPAEPAAGRLEFELDGINLDLTKSNATHVHLRQVNLSSEATFKCEVSADSPTFATVSAERQLKVYVLAKQKLALVDNLQEGAQTSQQQQQQPVSRPTLSPGSQNNGSRQTVYQVNELLNFTCLAGGSRPGAQLSWLLNDELLTVGAQNTSKLAALDIVEQARPLANQLMETRSTLTFRLLANQVKLLRKQQQLQRDRHQTSGVLSFKLTCLARLNAEFSSETSLLVSNGKARAQRRHSNELPQASSLSIEGQELSLSSDSMASRRRGQLDSELEESAASSQVPRWPQSGANNQRARQQAAVWSQRQLRAQAERIERQLARWRPNELEPPAIEAKSVVRRQVAPPVPQEEPTTDEETPDELEARTSGSNTTSTLRSPSIVISSEQLAAEPAAPSVGGGSSENPLEMLASRQLDRDYELDELVSFTCHPVLAGQRQPLTSPLYSVQVRWFINNQEITGNQVNTFDGEQFRHLGHRRQEPNWLAASNNSLLVEFSASLLQLKELALKCRTTLVAPLTELETSRPLQLATSPFIQAPGTSRPSSGYTVREPGARYQSSIGLNNFDYNQQPAGQQRHRANLIRLRQQSARSAGLQVARSSLLLMLLLLFVTLASTQWVGGKIVHLSSAFDECDTLGE